MKGQSKKKLGNRVKSRFRNRSKLELVGREQRPMDKPRMNKRQADWSGSDQFSNIPATLRKFSDRMVAVLCKRFRSGHDFCIEAACSTSRCKGCAEIQKHLQPKASRTLTPGNHTVSNTFGHRVPDHPFPNSASKMPKLVKFLLVLGCALLASTDSANAQLPPPGPGGLGPLPPPILPAGIGGGPPPPIPGVGVPAPMEMMQAGQQILNYLFTPQGQQQQQVQSGGAQTTPN